MNLHQIVSGAIGTVNPFVPAMIRISTGYTTSPDGTQVEAYATFKEVPVQVQALTGKDLRQLEGLNLNGTLRAIYMNGRADGVVRSQMKGGDLVTLFSGPNVGVWLVNQVLEQWPDWVKFACTMQNP